MPTSSPAVISTTRKTFPAVQNGYEWWSGNTTHVASTKVQLSHGKTAYSRVLDAYTISVNNTIKEGKWRMLPRHYPDGHIIFKDYRGIVKEVNDNHANTIGERLATDASMPIHTIYHERRVVIPAYDEVTTLYEEEGWKDAWVFYYGHVADTNVIIREDGDIERFGASWVVSLSHTRSALTPIRAVVLRGDDDPNRRYTWGDPLGFIPYNSRTDFVVDGKVVRQHTGSWNEGYSDFRLEWVKSCPILHARCGRRWTECVSPRKTKPTISRCNYVLKNGGVLMCEISSKNITDMAMNPFGEGSVAKNRKALADGLWYITETPNVVSEFAVGKARQNFLFKKELMEAVLHPDRVAKMVEKYGIEWVC